MGHESEKTQYRPWNANDGKVCLAVEQQWMEDGLYLLSIAKYERYKKDGKKQRNAQRESEDDRDPERG